MKQGRQPRYKLNVARDVDTDEPGVYILNLPAGFRFDHDVYSLEHVRAYDSMQELREDIKAYVIPCQCAECTAFINGTTVPGLKNI